MDHNRLAEPNSQAKARFSRTARAACVLLAWSLQLGCISNQQAQDSPDLIAASPSPKTTMQQGKDSPDSMALLQAAKEGNVAEVKALLQAGADVNAQDDNGLTALHWAAGSGDTEAVQALLLQAGADVNAQTDDGYTALHFVVGTRDTEAVQALLQAGADTETQSKDGYTALHLAAGTGQTEIVQALLQAGADVNAQDDDGYTALELAKEEGHKMAARAIRTFIRQK